MEIMNTLNSPVQPIAFDVTAFSFFTAVGNLWTWVAVLTATVSILGIRVAGSLKSHSHGHGHGHGQVLHRNIDESRPTRCEATEEEPDMTSVCSVVKSVCNDVGSDDGVTKGKFTVYYEENWECEGELGVAGELDGGNGINSYVAGGNRFDGWEEMVKMRMGDFGLYRFQDVTLLNGNVVRLWDGSRRRSFRSEGVVW